MNLIRPSLNPPVGQVDQHSLCEQAGGGFVGIYRLRERLREVVTRAAKEVELQSDVARNGVVAAHPPRDGFLLISSSKDSVVCPPPPKPENSPPPC